MIIFDIIQEELKNIIFIHLNILEGQTITWIKV